MIDCKAEAGAARRREYVLNGRHCQPRASGLARSGPWCDCSGRCEAADAILGAFGNTRAARAKVQCWQLGVSLGVSRAGRIMSARAAGLGGGGRSRVAVTDAPFTLGRAEC